MGECKGLSPGNESSILTRCHGYMKPLKGGSLCVKRKVRKTQKWRSGEKVVCFSLASLFPPKKWEAITQIEIRGTDHLMQRKTQRAGIVKGWEDKPKHGCIPNIFT